MKLLHRTLKQIQQLRNGIEQLVILKRLLQWLHREDIKNQEPKGDFIVGKAGAEHIIFVTKALIKYAEELIRENTGLS